MYVAFKQTQQNFDLFIKITKINSSFSFIIFLKLCCLKKLTLIRQLPLLIMDAFVERLKYVNIYKSSFQIGLPLRNCLPL